MVFEDLEPIEIPVKVGNKDMVLREVDEDGYTKYRNKIIAATRFGKDGKPTSVDGVANADPVLLSCCLFEKYQVGTETKLRPIPLVEILKWKSKIVRPLVEKAKEISDIKETAEEEETVESLETKIADLQERLNTLRNGDDHLKN